MLLPRLEVQTTLATRRLFLKGRAGAVAAAAVAPGRVLAGPNEFVHVDTGRVRRW